MVQLTQVHPLMGEIETQNIVSSMDAKWLTEGPWTKQLLELSGAIVGEPNILPAPNGTLGLYLALLALDLPRGGEIIMPSFTFYASAMSAVFAGLTPVFIDVEPTTYCMNLDQLEEMIGPDTVAIMPVHVYGTSADMEAICTIASDAGLKVIEDAAQSFGVNYKGKHTGIWGDIGVFSFFADKTITMGEGALVVTKNPDLYDRLKLLRNQGRPNSGTFIHPELGMNFRITDLQAAVGVGQLGRLPDIMKQRQRTYNLYREQLAGFADINLHEPSDGSEYVPFRLALTSRNKKNIDEILDQHDVASRSFFYPMHRQPKLVDNPRHKEMSVSEELYERGVCLPIHSNIRDLNVSYICNLVKKSFETVKL